MKKLFFLALSFLSIGLMASTASAADGQPAEATVLSVSGDAQVQLPGQTGTVALTEGMQLPQGAVITTGDNAQVNLVPLNGVLSRINENSTVDLEKLSATTDSDGNVTSQTAQLHLQAGNLASVLDPTMHNMHHYSVRTPAGVAASRGTAYSVTVTETGTTIATMSGTVVLTPVGGGAPIVIDIGTGMILDGSGNATGQTLAQLAADPASGFTAEDVGNMVETVAAAVQSGELTGPGSTTLLATVLKVASDAVPENATTYAQTTIAAAIDGAFSDGSVDIQSIMTTLQGIQAINMTALDSLLESLGLDVDIGGTTPITPVDPTVVSPSGGNQ